MRFLTLLGQLYDTVKYIGSVDVGIGIIGIKDTIIFRQSGSFIHRISFMPYDRNEYRRTERVSAIELQTGAKLVAKRLLMPLVDAMSQGRVNPFGD